MTCSPLIVPVSLFSTRPSGKLGATSQTVTKPVNTGCTDITSPVWMVQSMSGYDRFVGGNIWIPNLCKTSGHTKWNTTSKTKTRESKNIQQTAKFPLPPNVSNKSHHVPAPIETCTNCQPRAVLITRVNAVARCFLVEVSRCVRHAADPGFFRFPSPLSTVVSSLGLLPANTFVYDAVALLVVRCWVEACCL